MALFVGLMLHLHVYAFAPFGVHDNQLCVTTHDRYGTPAVSTRDRLGRTSHSSDQPTTSKGQPVQNRTRAFNASHTFRLSKLVNFDVRLSEGSIYRDDGKGRGRSGAYRKWIRVAWDIFVPCSSTCTPNQVPYYQDSMRCTRYHVPWWVRGSPL